MRPKVLLLPNLDGATHVDLVFDGNLANLAAAFSEHWSLAQAVRQERHQAKASHPLPTTKNQLRRRDLLETVKQLVLSGIGQRVVRQVA